MRRIGYWITFIVMIISPLIFFSSCFFLQPSYRRRSHIYIHISMIYIYTKYTYIHNIDIYTTACSSDLSSAWTLGCFINPWQGHTKHQTCVCQFQEGARDLLEFDGAEIVSEKVVFQAVESRYKCDSQVNFPVHVKYKS